MKTLQQVIEESMLREKYHKYYHERFNYEIYPVISYRRYQELQKIIKSGYDKMYTFEFKRIIGRIVKDNKNLLYKYFNIDIDDYINPGNIDIAIRCGFVFELLDCYVDLRYSDSMDEFQIVSKIVPTSFSTNLHQFIEEIKRSIVTLLGLENSLDSSTFLSSSNHIHIIIRTIVIEHFLSYLRKKNRNITEIVIKKFIPKLDSLYSSKKVQENIRLKLVFFSLVLITIIGYFKMGDKIARQVAKNYRNNF